MSKSVFNSLQVFRGLAALAVVVHHAGVSTSAFVGDIPFVADSLFSLGYLGVDFFFVLSGFIIMYSHIDDERNLPAVRRYLFKRLIRVFPPYLPISIALLILYSVMPEFSAAGGREYSLVSSLFLVPTDNPPALSVAEPPEDAQQVVRSLRQNGQRCLMAE